MIMYAIERGNSGIFFCIRTTPAAAVDAFAFQNNHGCDAIQAKRIAWREAKKEGFKCVAVNVEPVESS